ncbi:glycosyltransferase [Paenibacillus daejeonensis]|uniref:glycosyltransferase n=1 Tax=Paenibacillus daejeonensis TaxID=135193 RepID=UPI000381C662|nr:glycosyltransferase [Paenibacillus daejeonensis]
MSSSVSTEFADIQPMFLPMQSYPLTASGVGPTVIIYPPTIDWNWMKQRPQQLMEQFAIHGHEVYYCNKTQQTGMEIETLQPKLNLVHDNIGFIRECIPELKRQGRRIIVWTSWSKLHGFVEQYQPDLLIYDYVDDIPEWAPYLGPMVQRADLVITSAKALQRQITREYPTKPSCLVPNGCNLEHFGQYRTTAPDKPTELLQLQGPIAGFVGAWAHWVDQQLVHQLARSFPSVNFVIVGVEYAAKVDRSIPNLHYVGYKSYQELPRWMHFFDVCLIPFKINEITVAANPVKMYEYLASGKKVIATDLPEVRKVPHVWIGKGLNEWRRLLPLVLSEDTPFDALANEEWLREQNWTTRYHAIVEAVRQHLHVKV